jgi:L-fucose/D-arabinose isomerase
MSEFPRIGIRPTIDGRERGVRESLEEQTMGMATAVAELVSAALRYPDGAPVECVIADTTIGGIAEAAAAATKFKHENVGLTITVTRCWCYGTETMDMEPSMPHAVWGFNGTERPGAVYLAAVLAAHAQKGIPAFSIYGEHVQDADDKSIPEAVQSKLIDFASAGLAAAIMRGKSYLSIGGVSMGIAGSIVKDDFFQEHLGMRNEYVESIEIQRRIELNIYDEEEYKVARAWVRERCVQGADHNPEKHQLTSDEYEKQWDFVTMMAIIGRDLMLGNPKLADLGYGEEAAGHNAILAGFQGQRQWTDSRPNGDFFETIANTTFDWSGARRPHLVATENDSLNGVSMLFGHLLTNTPQIFSDVRTFWSPESVERVTGYTLEGKAAGGIIDLRNSGATTLDGSGKATRDGEPVMKPFWEMSDEDISACLAATTFHAANTDYFRGGGFSTHFTTEGGMPVTMTRINLVRGLGPVMQVAEGYTVGLPQDVSKVLEDRTDPLWPSTWFAPRLTGKGAFTSVYEVMNQWGANHGAISYGHIGAKMLTLASMLRIPVSMHNVPTENVFRPKVWSSFGSQDLESADFRACANFGPSFKTVRG